ncbi:MAG: acyl-CoA dehydrogenase family protein [Clostridia bacterium]
MDLAFTPEQDVFRGRVRAFMDRTLQAPFYREHQNRSGERSVLSRWWDRAVYEAGLAGLSWPQEYGGQGLGHVEEIIFAEECYRAGAPEGIAWAGKGLLGPVLLVHGTEEQRRHFLPRILSVDDVWCQGYSEPEAGSDLASLRTRAVRDGDGWRITGEKIWTSTVKDADWSFVLARTDPEAPKHRGISLFLVPLTGEGVTVRPLLEATGDPSFGSMQFDNAYVPDTHRVGEVNQGWRVANAILGFERGVTAIEQHGRYYRQFTAMLDTLAALPSGNALEDAAVQDRAASVLGDLEILRFWCLDLITQLEAGEDPGFGASTLKFFYSELFQRIGRLSLESQGAAVQLPGDGFHQYEYLWAIATNIFAGTREIQLDIIAEHILGLPRGDRQ